MVVKFFGKEEEQIDIQSQIEQVFHFPGWALTKPDHICLVFQLNLTHILHLSIPCNKERIFQKPPRSFAQRTAQKREFEWVRTMKIQDFN